ncbi:MAG: lipoprotein [Schumannella sp.]|nr:lipoprotein [Schumannella sp.]
MVTSIPARPHRPSLTLRRIRVAAVIVTLGIASAVGLTGCAPSTSTPAPASTEALVAGDIPDDQVFVPVTSASGAFTVSVPEGWSSATVNGVTTYTDKLNSISVEQTAVATAPTVDSVANDLLPHVLASRSNAAAGDVATFTAKGGSGIHLTYTADSAKDAVTGATRPDAVEVYLFWQGGQRVALTLEGPTTADNVDPWKIVSDSFTWTGK